MLYRLLSYHLPGPVLLLASLGAAAQPPALHPLAAFPLSNAGPVLRQPVQTKVPFTVAGQRGVLVGQQQGVFEGWILPVKLLSHMTIEANVEGYPVPLDLNSMAREIEVHPDHTTITYSHIALTLRQIMFAPSNAPEGTGAVVLFQVDAVRPVDLTFRFTGELRKMWPALSSGQPSPEWVAEGKSGFYVLHSDFDDFAGAVALPGATSGIMAPYQEQPQTHPLEFRLHVDPKADREKFYPLLMAVGSSKATASTAALRAKLAELDEALPALYTAHADHYRKQEGNLTQIITPAGDLSDDLTWAETSIDQLQARAPDGEIGLVAGYFASGDSARPGFGWFFGRDSLYTLYAIDSYGDFALAKTELEFLMKRQRADGKVMHEYSQTAGELDWKSLPYEYAAADATPLFLTAMRDYVRSSGDVAFLQAHRDAVMSAWNFETTHDADGDGIYDNAQGTGWVESWPPGMPKQEIYLALLDEQASRAMSELCALLGDAKSSVAAKARAETLHATIEHEYFRPSADAYAFSQNNGTLDTTATIYPTIAWWNGDKGIDHPQASLRRWASHDFATDWGARDIAASDPMYDSMSYHQGSVWPLFTGWAAIAQYRSGNALAGYQSLMQNADLTTAQDIGAVTELLSGDLFEPFGRSTSHQLWSSAMVATPLLRGLFGIDVDALRHEVAVAPHLPADWDNAEVRNLHVGDAVAGISFRREGTSLLVTLRPSDGAKLRLAGASGDGLTLRLPLPPVEVSIRHGLPLPGARTAQMKVLSESHEPRSLRLELEAPAGTDSWLMLRRNEAKAEVKVDGAKLLDGKSLDVHFEGAPGAGLPEYVTKIVTISW
jgi:glycogen debranching enzyme